MESVAVAAPSDRALDMSDDHRPVADVTPARGAWAISPEVAHVPGEDRHALVDLAAPATPPRLLVGSAAVIWECIDGVRDTDAIAATVAEAVGLDVDDVRDDVADFLAALASDGLLVGGAA